MEFFFSIEIKIQIWPVLMSNWIELNWTNLETVQSVQDMIHWWILRFFLNINFKWFTDSAFLKICSKRLWLGPFNKKSYKAPIENRFFGIRHPYSQSGAFTSYEERVLYAKKVVFKGYQNGSKIWVLYEIFGQISNYSLNKKTFLKPKIRAGE